ncbi:MAG: hypothetical protein ACJARD_001260, partial [Alphaproteobacteria bacterium]
MRFIKDMSIPILSPAAKLVSTGIKKGSKYLTNGMRVRKHGKFSEAPKNTFDTKAQMLAKMIKDDPNLSNRKKNVFLDDLKKHMQNTTNNIGDKAKNAEKLQAIANKVQDTLLKKTDKGNNLGGHFATLVGNSAKIGAGVVMQGLAPRKHTSIDAGASAMGNYLMQEIGMNAPMTGFAGGPEAKSLALQHTNAGQKTAENLLETSAKSLIDNDLKGLTPEGKKEAQKSQTESANRYGTFSNSIDDLPELQEYKQKEADKQQNAAERNILSGNLSLKTITDLSKNVADKPEFRTYINTQLDSATDNDNDLKYLYTEFKDEFTDPDAELTSREERLLKKDFINYLYDITDFNVKFDNVANEGGAVIEPRHLTADYKAQ